MGVHAVLLDHAPRAGDIARISGDDAHHALRVRRLGEGDLLALRDGAGLVGTGTILRTAKHDGLWTLDVRVDDARVLPPEQPALHVLACAPKGERLADMIDGLSQAGAASWAPLRTARSIVDPRETKLDRLARVTRESLKQCGRAWALRIEPPVDLLDLRRDGTLAGAIVADASGPPYERRGGPALTLLVGPEGGWTPDELAAMRDAGATPASFGRHVMRTEVAAVVAAACVMHLERPAP
ncbi:MAG: RsmE family RNA methyltransferase [Planctomycetota bacterium]|nr:RsmE family RNA methyltransferase [Planctomycetota bacterium]